MARAWVALGSNLGDPPAQLRGALRELGATAGITVERCSSFYRSAPLGPAGQDDYCNAVCVLRTEIRLEDLLARLQAIEHAMGRDRTGPRWGARIIDLDLLLYGDVVMDSPRLTLPHPELHRRNFVLAPLVELAPDLEVPGQGRVDELLALVGTAGVRSWPD